MQKLEALDDAYSTAMAKYWEIRLLAMEIALFVRPLTRMPEVVGGFLDAARLFREAGLFAEARGELLRAAEQVQKEPSRDILKAREILEGIRAEARTDHDLPSAARAALALAELEFDATMGREAEPDDTAVRMALAGFDDALNQYLDAGMASGEAEVRAAAGRKMLQYGFEAGAEHLRAAAESWEMAGHRGEADGAWRDLHLWHYRRGNTEEARDLEERIAAGPAIESALTSVTSGILLSQAEFARGNFADAVEISADSRNTDLEPGQRASLLLIEANSLASRGALGDAERAAMEAVALLRGAEPCALLGDALFQLGSVQAASSERFRLWEEAANNDIACGLKKSAAQRYANMAEFLSQSGSAIHLPDGRNVEDLFQQSENLTGVGRDLETIVLRGNIAQRRGIVAFRDDDIGETGKHFTEAESCFRRAGRASELAFTLGHQGLVLFQIARRMRSLESFEAASMRFVEAAGLFLRLDHLGEQHRMERLAGAASWEAGDLAAGTRRDELLDEAFQHYELAGTIECLLIKGRMEAVLGERQKSFDDFASKNVSIHDEYLKLCLVVRPDPAAAFRWLDRLKARGLLSSMVDQSKLQLLPVNLDKRILRKWLVLEAKYSAVEKRAGERAALKSTLSTSNLNGSSKKDVRDRENTLLGQELRTLQKEEELLLEETACSSEAASFVSLRKNLGVDWALWQQALKEQSTRPEATQRAVLSIHFVWLRNKGDTSGSIQLIACCSGWDLPRIAKVSTKCHDVESFIQQCFEGPGRSSLTTWLKMAGGDAAWCRRFASLIAPLAEWTQPGDIVLLIPHGPLHSVPLHALHIDGQPLAERNAVCFAPSAAILMVCWQRQKGQPGGKSAAVGCSNPGAGFPRLLRADQEAAFVGSLLGTSPLIADAISPEDFREAIADAWAVHFAGHATESESGWDSGLQLGGGNVFTVRDLFQTRLNADIFTLSGCHTARSRRRDGDEMLGLIPALLYSGASSVLASQWEAADDSTAELMQQFYGALHGPQPVAKADAFRSAIAQTRRIFPNLPQWAAFTLHGDWK